MVLPFHLGLADRNGSWSCNIFHQSELYGVISNRKERTLQKATKIMMKTRLSDSLEVSPIIHGLWQIADMERDRNVLDPIQTGQSMHPYVQKGFTTFDMADHYGSAEVIAGHFSKNHFLELFKLPIQHTVLGISCRSGHGF